MMSINTVPDLHWGPLDPGQVVRSRLESRPFFLVGAERSGTTLLRLMLDRHPKLSWHGEFEFAVDQLAPDGTWPPRSAFIEALRKDRVFNHWKLAVRVDDDPAEIVHDFLLQWRERTAKPRIGATIHRGLDRIPMVWPQARYVHIVRDPRDVSRSMMAMNWDGNAWTAVDRWIEVERSWDRLRERLDGDRWIEVRFEDLVRAPQIQIARLCRFLGVPYDASMLTLAEDSSYESPEASLAERWRKSLSRREVRWIESKAAAVMSSRGYVPEDPSTPPLGAIASSWLRLSGRATRALRRVRILGPRLWIASVVSRRVGTGQWRDSVRRSLHSTAEAKLK